MAMLTGQRTKGYTLLFAVLTAALVLGVAAFILEISTKQYELSASARDSLYAYYAADSGIECVSLRTFGAGGQPSTNIYDPTHVSTISCGYSSNVSVSYSTINSYEYQTLPDPLYASNASTTSFSLQLSPNASQPLTCAVITIIEYYDASAVYHDITQSRGYNHCALGNNLWGSGTWGPDTTNPNTVERAIQLSHTGGS